MAKICFFNSNKFWGGGEKWHFEAALSMKKRGHEVWVVGYPDGELINKSKAENIDVFPIEIGNLSFLNIIKRQKLASFFKAKGIDAIIMNGPADLKSAAFVAKKVGVPKIMYRRGLPTTIKSSSLNKKLFTDVLTHIIVNSENTYHQSFVNYKEVIPSDKFSVIYNGIHVDHFENALKTVSEPIRLANIGRLSHEKGQKDLINLAKAMIAKEVDFRIHIAGEGEEKEPIRDAIRENELSEYFVLEGFVSDMQSFLKDKHCLVVSSHWEGFGFVMIEAMASNVPVFSVELPVAKEIIIQGETGFVVNDRNWEVMSQKIIELLMDKEAYHKMSVSAKKSVLEKFDIENKMSELEHLIIN